MDDPTLQRHQELMEYWKSIIIDCHNQGSAVRAYIKSHNLTESSYYYWRDELWIEGIEVFPGFLASRAGCRSLRIDRRLRVLGLTNPTDQDEPEFVNISDNVLNHSPAKESGQDHSLKIRAGIFSLEFSEDTPNSLLQMALSALKEVEA